MQKTLGKIILAIGIVVFVFFLYYRGNAIPVKELWFTLSIFIMGAGAYYIAKHKLEQPATLVTHDSSRFNETQQLIDNGEKVKVTLDNAEVKTRSYQQEAIKEDMPTQI